MTGDIIQDRYGWFYRDNGNGTADNLSAKQGGTIQTGTILQPTVLVRDDTATGNGDRLASGIALMLAKRYR